MEMEEMILHITENEIIPLIAYGIFGGFSIGTIIYFITYGIFKAFRLVNIIKH